MSELGGAGRADERAGRHGVDSRWRIFDGLHGAEQWHLFGSHAERGEAVPLDNYLQWWRYVPGANWRHPTGPASDIKGKGNYPVVQVAYADAGLAPVAQFPPNGYGLYDMAGNVWQWCSDWYRADYYFELKQTGVVVRNPQGPPSSYDPGDAQPPRVHRGGSFLCTDEYCTRYMLGTRGKGDVDTGSNHLGFRCVKPAGPDGK